MADIATLGIRVNTQGVREATSQLGALEKQGAATERRASQLGKAWGVALGRSVAAGAAIAATGFAVYLRNSIAAEKVQAQLTARIKSTAGAAGLAVRDLNKMAAALQGATTFDDESIGRAQATLLTFTRVGAENFKRATEAVLDMSTALGTDLNSAALQVGKALNDPVQGLTALSRAGVQFNESQKTTIKQLVETGRVADAQRIILAELEMQMGGSARAARDTLGGALVALKNSFDNLLEGDAGGLRGTKEAVEGFNRALNDPGLKQGLDTAFTGMLNLANGAVQLIAKLGNAASALREFYGETSKQSRNVLQNRRNDLEGQLFAAQRRSGQGLADANDPLGKMFGLASGRDDKVAKIKAQIAEIDRALVQLGNRRDDWIEGRVTRKAGQGIFANVSSERGMGPVATLDTSTGQLKEKALRSFAGAAREAADAVQDFTLEEARLTAASLAGENARSQALVTFERIRAELGGPLAQAQFEHIQAMQEIQRLGEQAGIGASAIVAAQDAQRAAYERTTEAIREQQFAAANPEAMQIMDSFRRGAVDTLTDIVTGAQSAKDALKDFFDSLHAQITRALAQGLIEQLFGAPGTSGQGSSFGGGLMSLFGSLFGGQRAIGGPVSAGQLYEVGERGPELLTAGGRNFILPGRAGTVTPASSASQGTPHRGPAVVHQTINVQGKVDRRTASQIAMESGDAVGRAQRRLR